MLVVSEVKSHEFDRLIERDLPSQRLYLLYGPDRGLISERAAAIAAKTGVDLKDPFSLIRLDGSDLQQAPGRLADEANALGLFGGQRLVWIKASGSEKGLIEGFAHLAAEPPRDAYLLIEAGDLKKNAPLRKAGETARSVLSIACYADDARSLNALIDQELGKAGLRVTPEARELLRDSLGGDRIASRNEIAKLALYCRDMPVIEESHVSEIIGDASAASVDDAVDAVLKGDMEQLTAALRKITASKTPIFLVLQSCLRQYQQLDLMRSEMDAGRRQAGDVIATLGRGLHFRRKPIVEAALRSATPAGLGRDLKRLQAAIFQSRSRAALEDDIAAQALLAVAAQARRG